MEQVVPFNVNTAGTTKYLCLANVRKGYGIGAKYPDATTAWNNTQQHRDRNFPAGCAVPIFFNWTGKVEGVTKNWGHVGVRLADGRFWTDGKFYQSVGTLMAFYLKNGNPSYLGWGESLNGVPIVKSVTIEPMAIIQDAPNWYARCNDTHWRINGEELSRAAFLSFVNKEFLYFVETISALKSAATTQEWQNTGKVAVQDNWEGQIHNLNKELTETKAKLNTCLTSGGDIAGMVKENNAILKWLKSAWESVFKTKG